MTTAYNGSRPSVYNTSGNNEVQYISVMECIASACRQAGMMDSDLTPQILSYGKLRLNLILQNLANRNIPLWLIETVVVGLSLDQTQYQLPQYVYDVLNCNWRRTSATNFVASGGVDPSFLEDRNWFAYATTTDYFKLQLIQPKMDTIGLLFFGTQTVTLTIQVSTDDVTYTTLQAYAPQEYQDGIWLWQDFNPSQIVNYVKVTCAAGETLSLRNIYVSNLTSANEIVMTRMNRDTFAAYPNKRMPMTPIAFYFDRQISPILNIWGQPTDVYDWQLVLRWQRNFQNVGSLTQQLEVPYYYLDAIISELASRIILELPRDKIDLQRIPILKQKAAEDLNLAETSTMDLSPISLIPNLSSYTM